MSMTRRGFFSRPIISSMEWAPMTLVPLASLLRKSSTFETVRLKAATVNPWSFMFKIRFWPITASPITAISALGSMLCIVTGAANNARLLARRQRFIGVYQALDVELEEEHVAVSHDVIPAFDAVMAGLRPV